MAAKGMDGRLTDAGKCIKGKETYMKMFSAGVGIGAGVKDFRRVFIFSTKEAFDSFV